MIFINRNKISNNKQRNIKNVKKCTVRDSNPRSYICKLLSLPIVLCYLFKIKSQLKVHEDEQIFIYSKIQMI